MTEAEGIATQRVWTVDEMQRRLRNLHALMDERSLDAVILTSLHNVLYYSGFFCPPFGRLHSAVVPRKGDPALIVSLIEDVRPRHCCYFEDIRPFHDWQMSPLENNLRLFGEVLRDNGIRSGRLGYEGGFGIGRLQGDDRQRARRLRVRRCGLRHHAAASGQVGGGDRPHPPGCRDLRGRRLRRAGGSEARRDGGSDGARGQHRGGGRAPPALPRHRGGQPQHELGSDRALSEPRRATS